MKTYPLSQSQLGVYMEYIQHPESIQYNLPCHIRLSRNIDTAKLKDAIERVINAYPVFYTKVTDQEGELRQYPDYNLQIDLQVERMTEVDVEQRLNEFMRPFDLSKDALTRFLLIETPDSLHLVYDIFHLVADGLTYKILTCLIELAYNNLDLPSEKISLYEYAEMELQTFETPQYTRAAQYYKDKFHGVEMTRLLDKSDEDVGRVEKTSVLISKSKVDDFCMEHRITPNLLFMAAFEIVLSRISREKDVVYSSINHGRNDKKIRQTLGMFVKTVPIAVQLKDSQSVVEFAKAHKQELMSTIRNGIYPFTHLCQQLGLNPELSFGFQGEGIREDCLFLGEQIKPEQPIASGLSAEKPSVIIYQTDTVYEIRLKYVDSQYNSAYMDRFAQSIANCIQDIIDSPDKLLKDVSIVSQQERQELIALGTGEELLYDHSGTFIDLFRKQVALYPDSTAVVDEVGEITYVELDTKSDLLAHSLVSRGVVADSFVAVMLPRRKEFLVSVLGVFKAGGAYIPFDSDYPNDRLLYMLGDSAAKVLITTRELFDEKQKEGDFSAENIVLVDEFDFNQSCEQINLSKPENLAYMIYTSGSTGKPKGVMVEHKGLCALIGWIVPMEELKPGDNCAEHSSFSFDASLLDLYPPLSVGGVVHLLGSSLRQDIDGIYKYLKQHNIIGATFSTQLGMELLNLYDLPLRYLAVGGEKLKSTRPSSVKVINVYGPTEFTVSSSYHVVDRSREYTNIPIGRAVPNTTSAIVDQSGNLVPRGVAGELCLIGRQIARGYWNRPELTAEKFVDCPFIASEKMYRTGDLARWNENGELEYLGRIDNQVKLRGFRIELGEIESAMSKYSGIHSAITEVKEIGGTQYLCGYYTSQEAIDEENLREKLSASLADYMVPTVFMRLEALPLTPNGKVNRKALPIPEIKSITQYTAPINEVEQSIADLIQSVLNVSDPVGRDDSFFSLGGDSIKSIRLVSLLREKGITIQVSDIMKLKTVKAIAVAASQNGETRDVDQSNWSGEVAYTAIEQFFFDQNLPKPAHFNQSAMLQSTDRVDVETLRKSLKTLATHHDMLRAVYKEGKQYVRKPEGEGDVYSLEICDLREDIDCITAIESKAEEMQSSIDLQNGPLFKSILFRLPDYDAILIVIHHLVVDGVSWRILTEDINIAYDQILRGKEPKLPPKSNSFKEWAEAIGRYRQSYPLIKEVEYWRSVQQEIRNQSLPKERSSVMHGIQRSLAPHTTKKLLGESSKAYNTEVNDLLVTALGRSYSAQTNERSLSIEMEGHGREPIHEPIMIDRTVGWFTSAYPMVIKTDIEDMRLSIRSVKETLRRIPNRGLGYGILQHVGQDNNSLDREITPQILFNYLGEFSEIIDNSMFTLNNTLPQGSAVAAENVFGVAMSINCFVADGELRVMYSYDPAVWSDERANVFADCFIRELENVVAHTTDCREVEYTASDLGETMWSDQEFTSIYAHYKEKGEEIDRIYPLTPMQEGMLLQAMTDTDSATYHVLIRYSLDILPAPEQLEYVLDQLSIKHEVLRTAIISSGVREPRQVLLKGRRLGLYFIDISLAENKEHELQRIEKQEFNKPIDLQEEPLFRLVCIKTGQNACQLLFVMHHIIIDGWCTSIYINDFKEYLSEIISGNIQLHKNSNGRYEQYVREVATKDSQVGLSYWRELLSGYDTKAVIESYGPIAPEKRSAESSVMVELDKEIFNTLKDLCSKEEVTINSAVELAWGLLLQCYNRSQDAVFVKVVSGRNSSKESVEDLVGLFINSIPVRVTAEAEDTLVGLLGKMQRQAAESNEFDYCPLSEVQQQSELGRDLFQSILAFENYAISQENDFAGLFNLKLESAKEEAISEIGVVAYVGDSLVLGANFDTALYHIEEMRLLVSCFTEIITAIATKPDLLVSELSLVGEQQRQELIALGTGEELLYDRSGTFIDLFRKQVALYPDSTAVVDEVGEITYVELDTKSDLLAHSLVSRGVVADSFVAVMLPRRKEFLVSVLGVFKAGGAYIPFDSDYPNDRLLYMLGDSAAKVLITTRELFDEKQKEGDFSAENIVLVDEFDFNQSCEQINLSKPENLAYMIYTSGSTGKPKGVMVEHKGLCALIGWIVPMEELKPGDNCAEHSSFSFDASLLDLYPPLSVGGVVHLLGSSLRQDIDGIYKYLKQHNIIGATFSTQLGMELLNLYDLPLRYLAVGGEKLKSTRPSSVKVINVYGPTEFTVSSSYHVVDRSREYTNIPIGRAVPNTTSAIVDQSGNLVPRGVAGELCLIGRQIARGYWNRPELTAEKFVDCPFIASEKMYRTGDLARWNENGELEYLGRIDNQVKLRGFRIELGEIESAMSKYSGIHSAITEVKEIGGTQYLCGYYTSQEAIDEENLREKLSASLADYMVPTVFMRLEALPLTPNGKINRKALPMPKIKTENIVAPETGKERVLLEIVKNMLNIEEIGVLTDITRIGITSLSAIKLATIANERGLKLKANDILKHKTIRRILSKEMSLGFWANDYQAEKPLVILIHALTWYERLEPLTTKLMEQYSVFVIEPLSEHFHIIFQDADLKEVVLMYTSLLDFLLPQESKVHAFIGYCFGGELVYRCAVQWEQMTTQQPRVFLIDTNIHKDDQWLEAVKNNLYEVEEMTNDVKFMLEPSEIMSTLVGGNPIPLPLYEGDITLFIAMYQEPKFMVDEVIFANFRDGNVQQWRALIPHLNVVNVNANHIDILAEEHMDLYAMHLSKNNF